MSTRSYLFVPAGNDAAIAAANASAADAVILDLEDSIDRASRAEARAKVKRYLSRDQQNDRNFWVRINPIQSVDYRADIDMVVGCKITGLFIPKIDSPAMLQVLDEDLRKLERERGLDVGQIRVIPIATETPAAVMSLGEYRNPPPRLAAMTWGSEDLSVAISAFSIRDEDGAFTF